MGQDLERVEEVAERVLLSVFGGLGGLGRQGAELDVPVVRGSEHADEDCNVHGQDVDVLRPVAVLLGEVELLGGLDDAHGVGVAVAGGVGGQVGADSLVDALEVDA